MLYCLSFHIGYLDRVEIGVARWYLVIILGVEHLSIRKDH